uniref:Uncharacterized protein n=1 Tax=Aegilops tauschii subsp. strangulata TaxID=200361 RepID=A0A453CCW7_AEGTS
LRMARIRVLPTVRPQYHTSRPQQHRETCKHKRQQSVHPQYVRYSTTPFGARNKSHGKCESSHHHSTASHLPVKRDGPPADADAPTTRPIFSPSLLTSPSAPRIDASPPPPSPTSRTESTHTLLLLLRTTIIITASSSSAPPAETGTPIIPRPWHP